MSDMFHLAEKQLSKKIFYNISQNFEVKWNEKNLTPQNNWRLGMWCIKDNNCFSQPRWAKDGNLPFHWLYFCYVTT